MRIDRIVGVIVCLLVGIISVQAQDAFSEYLVPKSFDKYPSFTHKDQPVGTADVTLTIDPSKPIHGVHRSLFGQNAGGWQGNVTTTDTREQNWKNANYSMMRYPGGNWSNKFFWDGNIPASIKTDPALPGGTSDLRSGTTAWMLETDEFPDLINHLGSDPIVCVNVGWAFYGTDTDPVSTAAQYAADWVNYYNNTLGLNVKYWELGNENYGSWQAGYDLATPEKYAQACVAFATAMKAVDPDIEVGVVLYEHAGGMKQEPQGQDWNEKILPIVKDIMDFAILHQYPHPNTNKNDLPEQAMYDAASTIKELTTLMQDQFQTYAGKQYPIAITEFNARTGVRELSYCNALFMTMMLGEMALYDVEAAMQWDLQNGYDSDGGNHAATASKDPFMTKGDANVTLYVHYYMDKYFGDTIVEGTSSNADIVMYPTTFSSGEYGLVLVNRAETDQTIEIDFANVSLGERMYWHTIKGDGDDFDRTIFINDQGPGTTFTVGQNYTDETGTVTLTATTFEANGVGGPQDYTSIMPYSSQIAPGVNPKFEAPALSVSYIVLESAGDNCAIPSLGEEQSLCGVTELILETGLSADGKTFTWSDANGTLSETGNSLSVTQAGTYTVQVDSAGCVAADAVIITDHIPAVDLGGDVHLCEITSKQIDVNVSGEGLAFNWKHNGNTISTEPSITLYDAGTYDLTISGGVCTEFTEQIVVTSDLIDVSFDTICEAGQANLQITETGNFGWYGQDTDGTELSTALTYIPDITETTTYYAQDNNSTKQTLGKTALDGTKWANGTGKYVNWGRTLEMVVEQELTIVSFDISVNASADVVLNITDGVLYSKTFNFNGLATGMQTIALNETFAPGTYTIDLIGTTGGVDLQIDNNGSNSYSGLISWSCPQTADHYGYFYNWVIATGSTCARTPVLAVIDESHTDCEPVFVTQELLLKTGWNLISLYVNPTNSQTGSVFQNAEVVKTQDAFWSINQRSYLNSLPEIQAGKGYLVYNSVHETIEVTGLLINTSANQHILKQGWNLIGVPSQTPFSVSGLPVETESVKDFGSFFIPPTNGLLQELLPGKAYFIKVTTDCEINW